MQQQRLGQHLADGHARVERAVGVLEDELGAGARMRRSSAPDSEARSRPAKRTLPAVGSSRRRASRPTVDLPQPDSPTSASVSPAAHVEGDAIDGPHDRRRRAPSSDRRATKCLVTLSSAKERRAHATSASSGAFQQREACPAPRSARGGARLRQRSSANGQRVAKRQPVKAPARLGTLPEMVASRSRRADEQRNGAEQADRVWMLRRREQPGSRRLLDDLAGIHDRHVVAGLGHHAQIMGDEDDGRAGLLAQLGAADRGSAPGW